MLPAEALLLQVTHLREELELNPAFISFCNAVAIRETEHSQKGGLVGQPLPSTRIYEKQGEQQKLNKVFLIITHCFMTQETDR